MDVLKISNLTATYNNNHGIYDITIDIKKGEFIGLIGHNGAGKTTLINSIIGIKDFQGEIFLNNKYNKIGNVSQKQVIDWYLSVESNIKMEEMLIGKSNNNLFLELIDLLDLKNNLKQNIEELSGGQLQRVQIARALLKDAEIYFLDEPTSGVDIYISEKILKYLKDLSEKGKTIIISSYDIELIEKYCKRLIVLSKGKISYDGEVNEFTKEKTLRDRLLEEIKNEK